MTGSPFVRPTIWLASTHNSRPETLSGEKPPLLDEELETPEELDEEELTPEELDDELLTAEDDDTAELLLLKDDTAELDELTCDEEEELLDGLPLDELEDEDGGHPPNIP